MTLISEIMDYFCGKMSLKFSTLLNNPSVTSSMIYLTYWFNTSWHSSDRQMTPVRAASMCIIHSVVII